MNSGTSGHANRHHEQGGWGSILTPQDAGNLLIVIITSWITAIGTLIALGRFHVGLMLTVLGFVTVLIVLSTGVSLLIAAMVQKVPSHRRGRSRP
ncbi:hypothetical protein [Microvirga sp. P5_D2]